MTSKPSNPKDLVGTRKVGLSVLPFRVLWECAVGMLEGTVKYGRHNYRAVGVRASVYFDAAMRHLGAWWEGEDIDPESKLSHVNKAIISLMVLRDSMIEGNWVDDRPIGNGFSLAPLHTRVGELIDMHADKNPHHYTRMTPTAPVEGEPAADLVPTVRVMAYPPDKKVAMIKAIRSINGDGLKEAKDLSETEGGFDIIVRNGTKQEALVTLRQAGAFV